MIEESNTYYFMDLISKVRETSQIDRKMRDTLILADALDTEIQKKGNVKELKKYLYKFMRDRNFRRLVNIRNKMMSDTEEALTYLLDDYPTDPEHIYNQELEVEIMEIEERIGQFLSVVIKELLSEEISL